MAALNAQATTEDAALVTSAFVEGTPQDINRDVLFAPQLVYPIRQMFRLPNNFDEKAIPARLLWKRRVFLAAMQRQMLYASWLVQNLPGYRAESLGEFGAVMVLKFKSSARQEDWPGLPPRKAPRAPTRCVSIWPAGVLSAYLRRLLHHGEQ